MKMKKVITGFLAVVMLVGVFAIPTWASLANNTQAEVLVVQGSTGTGNASLRPHFPSIVKAHNGTLLYEIVPGANIGFPGTNIASLMISGNNLIVEYTGPTSGIIKLRLKGRTGKTAFAYNNSSSAATMTTLDSPDQIWIPVNIR